MKFLATVVVALFACTAFAQTPVKTDVKKAEVKAATEVKADTAKTPEVKEVKKAEKKAKKAHKKAEKKVEEVKEVK
ncbi:MAG: hypothetical protein WCQ47_01335 [bacterium]